MLYKTRICCCKLSGEFTREPGLDRKALFSSSSLGPNSCLVVLRSEGSEALFKWLSVVRAFCLFSPTTTLGSIQRKVTNIHRISHVGKAPRDAASHGCKQLPLLLR